MTVMLIAFNGTRESGNFMGDQLCSLKTAYLFVENQPDVDRVLMSMSRANEFNFLWDKFIEKHKVEAVWDDWNPGDWDSRWMAWDIWRTNREIQLNDGTPVKIDHYRELYLRIHGAQRQNVLCGMERGLGRRNIYQYWYTGQEHCPEELSPEVDWFDDTLINHPERTKERDVYISPHCKTQGNLTFTFEFWADVIHKLVDMGVSVTMGWDAYWFCEDLNSHSLFKRHWGDHKQWMEEICKHKMVACGNTGTGWLAAACGVPMITMEPHHSMMADHRYRECGLRNIVEVIDGHKLDELSNNMSKVAQYVAGRIHDEVKRKIVMTTGCYDILHAGHIRHLERAKALGTKLIVALNNDNSIRGLKGPERPINPCDQRKTVLEALRCVDEVVTFDGPNALHIIERIKPDVLCAGYGYSLKDVVGKNLVESWGGKVVVTCTGDARTEPSTTKIAHRSQVANLADIVRAGAPYSVNPVEKLTLMANEFLSVAHLDGDIADLGTCRGGTALILRRLAPDKHLHLFDTWDGTPYDDPLCHHKKGEWKADFIECRKVVGTSEFTWYHKGLMLSTATKADNDGDIGDKWRFCFVYCDMDTYQATLDAINFFLPRLVKGGKLMIDDYGWEPCAGVKKAVDEMFPTEECQRYADLGGIPEKRVIQSQYSCVITWRAGK